MAAPLNAHGAPASGGGSLCCVEHLLKLSPACEVGSVLIGLVAQCRNKPLVVIRRRGAPSRGTYAPVACRLRTQSTHSACPPALPPATREPAR